MAKKQSVLDSTVENSQYLPLDGSGDEFTSWNLIASRQDVVRINGNGQIDGIAAYANLSDPNGEQNTDLLGKSSAASFMSGDIPPTYIAPIGPKTGTPAMVAPPSGPASESMMAPVAPPALPNIWISEGPSPGINGQETVAPNNQINGAIQAIAVHPTDANIMYVGSVNGGIWKTTNATAASPHWVPLIDNLPSLSIGALEFDPTDATHQTLIAGIGATSSYGATHDPLNGVLRSTDGGTTWSQLGVAALAGDNITSVAARGATLLAAAESNWGFSAVNGLFRSTNSGATWTSISDGAHGLPSGISVSDIVGDPLNANVFYAAVTGATGGVFRSVDTGLNWTNITGGIGIIGATTDKIELAFHHDATNASIFAIVDNGGVLSGVFRSLNGASFTALNTPTGGTQGQVHGAVAADPNNFNIVYVGLGGGSANYLTRIDASQPSGSQITKISAGTFGSPHVDTRELQIDASGNLILGTDGGLFSLPTPTANSGVWKAIVGDMSVFELHSIAYDHVSDIIMAGAQDNGTLFQLTPGGATWDHPFGGDGGDVVIDDVSRAGMGQSIRYFSAQNLGGWTRQVYDSANHLVSSTALATISDPLFTTPVELNSVDPMRLLVGGSGHIYQSLNQGTTLTSIATIGVNSVAFHGGGVMVYGGYQGGVGNSDLVYAASGSNVLRQTTSGGGFTTLSPGGGGDIRGITDDPTNYSSVFAIDNNQVFRSTNGGTTWTDVTGNLTSVSTADFFSIEYVHGAVNDALVVGTSSGVFFATVSGLGGAAAWGRFGGNLPDVIVYDLEYDAVDNVLVAGTFGRGAWLVNNVRTNLGIDSQPTPDLTASNVALNGATISYKINNIGAAASIASSTGIYLSADSTITTSDTFLTPQATAALAASASVSQGLALSLPTNLTPGTYYLGVVADYNAQVTESNEANNASTAVAVILGNNSGNTLAGTSGNDTFFGFDGNDIITGLAGNDRIDGGAGDDTAVFSGNLAAYTLSDLSNRVMISGLDGSDVVYAVEHLQFADGTINFNDGDPLFDAIFYARNNLDVFHAGVDLRAHYNSNGWHEGRDPNPLFDTSAYLLANGDVAAAGVNPLAHYASNGWQEGRDPSLGFDNEFYLAHYPDVAAAHVNPLAHYLQSGMNEGRMIGPAVGEGLIHGFGFDREYYLMRYEDVARAGVDSEAHYNSNGWHDGRDPSAYFSTNGYLAVYPDIQSAGVNPLQHYDLSGWREGRDPNFNFDTEFYLLHNSDIRAANIDPLFHYLYAGITEGRAASPAVGNIIQQGGFDAEYYIFRYPDLAAAHVDPLAHYNSNGHNELRNPNGFFDAVGYLANNPDVAAAHVDPFQHYETVGWMEGRNPSQLFDTSNYLATYADIASAHVNPLDHFLSNGIHEGRLPLGNGLWF